MLRCNCWQAISKISTRFTFQQSIPITQHYLPFQSSWVHPRFLVGFVLLDLNFICIFCWSLFVLLYFFFWPLCYTSVLRYTDSDCPFGIFKLFLPHRTQLRTDTITNEIKLMYPNCSFKTWIEKMLLLIDTPLNYSCFGRNLFMRSSWMLQTTDFHICKQKTIDNCTWNLSLKFIEVRIFCYHACNWKEYDLLIICICRTQWN